MIVVINLHKNLMKNVAAAAAAAVASVVSNSVRPQRQQRTRIPCPWDSPGKNTGVGCHVLLQCMKVQSESEVAQSCPTLSDSMDCSLPGSSVHGICQARVLEWGCHCFLWQEVEPQYKKKGQIGVLFSLCWSSSQTMLLPTLGR